MLILCPECGSADIQTLDVVACTNRVTEWEVDKSGLPIPVDYDAADVSWDSSAPDDPAHPYQCGDCYAMLAPADLTVSSDPES